MSDSDYQFWTALEFPLLLATAAGTPCAFALVGYFFAKAERRPLVPFALSLVASVLATAILVFVCCCSISAPLTEEYLRRNPPADSLDDGVGSNVAMLFFGEFFGLFCHLPVFGFAFLIWPDGKPKEPAVPISESTRMT